MRNRFLSVGAFLFCVVMGMSGLRAQTAPTGDEDPTAKTGALKSQIETAGSYNAHSGNATRIVPDLNVPGALGVYGLDFIRYYNSLRSDRIKNLYLEPAPEPNQPMDFGAPGWSHSWRWSADYEEYLEEVGGDGGDEIYHMLITITFPDGRASKYKIIRTKLWPYGQPWPPDPRFGPPFLASHGETNWPGGFHDRLGDMAEDGSNFWLYREDGGSVHFTGGPGGWVATEVFDPHGFKTTLRYNASWQLDRVEQEVGGRYLNLTWQNGRIWKVQGGGSGGSQTVEYTCVNGLLSSVTYPNEVKKAQYTYVTLTPPTGFYNAGPLLATADDPRFEGAMTNISYTYQGTGCRPQGQPWPPPYTNGQFDYYYSSPTAIKEEKHRLTGAVVSRFTIGCFDGTRMEYNGLGGFRKFFFGRSAGGPGTYSIQGYQLAKLTDFTHIFPLPADLPFEWQNYYQGHPRQIWDGRGILTEAVHGDGSGLPVEIRHVGSDGSICKYDRVNPGASAPRDTTRIRNGGNHWLFSKTDERGFTTTYKRDARRRITQITYPDGSMEQFTYDDLSNQVKTHTLPSGAVETKTYYPAGHAWQYLLWKEWNSVDGGEPNAKIYTYDNLGRVATVSEPRNRTAVPAKDFSTRMTYNGRHQVTKVEYAGMLTATDNPSVSYGYDDYGNCTSITNELGEQSLYTYDDYRRCIKYEEPLNAPDWKGTLLPAEGNSRTWDWTYDRVGPDNASISAMAHTSKEWRLQIEPPYDAAGNRRAKVRHYDYNNLLVFEYDSVIQAPNNGFWTYPADAALHSYTYDENGQKSTYTDPLSRVTSYTYDNRNRLFETIEPLNRTTSTLYDVTGNKTKVTFPDLKTQQWLDYDAFGQAWRFIDERNNTTNLIYCWGAMKKLYKVTTHRDKDGGGTEDQLTTFSYDLIGRPIRTDFPDPDSYEASTYQFGQLKTWRTREGQLKTIVYDERGREKSHSWSDTTPDVTRVWDKANRLTSISNLHSKIEYTYDDAGQVITEGNTLTGASAGRRDTTYWRYPNGVPAHIIYPNGWRGRRDYHYRGQLQTTGQDNASGAWTYKLGEYAYFKDGKVQTETAYNGVRTVFTYDGRGQTRTTHTYRISPLERYSYRTYDRDTRDRISAWYKSNSATYNVLENGRGDRYGYDAEGQLTAASYEALTPSGTPTGAKRTESFIYDALGNRKGVNQLAGRGATTFTRTDNGLNQYTSWTPSVINYDDDISGPPGNGVLMQEGTITAFYNALNQPTTIFGGTLSAGMNFGFDPLGRCVKRWVNASALPETNPATYFYYDGWNLIQEGTGAAAAERIYLPGNRVDGIVCHYNYAAAQWRYHHYDARGHCVLLTGPTGALIEQYEYDAFGKPYFYSGTGVLLPNGSTYDNRFLFTGREWLEDVRLYDYRHRLYQPELGRFLQPDPKHFAAGDYNLYRYCQNDPVNKTDPDGQIVPAVLLGIWAAYEVGSTIYDAYTAAETFSDPNSSTMDKVLTGGGLVASAALPGGGYGTGLKTGKTAFEHTRHSLNQKISREVKSSDELKALKDPLKKTDTKVDSQGRESQKLIGEKATVTVNPETKKIITVHPTSKELAERLKKRE